MAFQAPLRQLAPLLALTALALALVLAPAASADVSICSAGTGAGKCESPQGVAVDNETGRLFVADRGNNRIDVFKADGSFELAFGWGVSSGGSKFETCTTSCQAGIAGSGAGQFDRPTWIAVDNTPSSPSRHDVYVGTDNFRVQKFKSTGDFVKAFGSEGTGPCQFSNTGRFYRSDPLAVGPDGDVYVADDYASAPDTFTNRIERFDTEGKCLGEVVLFTGSPEIRQFAVDSAGDFYVTTEGGGGLLRKYSASGALLYELGSDEPLTQAIEAQAPTIDASDNVFTKQRGRGGANFISEYDSGGTVVRRFDYAIGNGNAVASGLAAYHSGSGDLFASEQFFGANGVRYLSFPPLGPVVMPEACKVKTGSLGNVKAILQAEVNPEGKATTVHFEYVTEDHFQKEGFANPETTDESESLGSDFNMHETDGEAALVPETTYHCRAVATNADAPGGIKGQEGSFTSLPPLQIGETSVSNVGTEAATLNATVNPLGIATTGYFEYVEEATYLKDIEELGPEHGFDHATKAPDPEAPIEFGAGESFKAGSSAITGLKAGTSYRFRVLATDVKISPREIAGPTTSFRTFGFGEAGLPDDRAWELVSPGLKSSAEVAVPGQSAGFFEPRSVRIQAGATSGEAITYTSWTSFGDAEGAFATSQYLSKRTPTGWGTENISPFGFLANPLTPPFNGFSADLRFGAFKTTEPALTPDCRKSEDLYLRDNQTGELRCLDPEVVGGPESACLVYAGASEDGSRTFLAGKPSGGENFTYSLYESTPGGVQQVSIFPNGEAAPASGTTSFGRPGATLPLENCQFGLTFMRHVISADGSRAFWTYVPDDGTKPSQLFVRVDGTSTIQLDALQGGSDKTGGNGVFQAASADGSLAYFTDAARLVKGARAEADKPDLYRYAIGEEPPLTDLTKGTVPGEVEGVIGASDDGSYVYFVAKAALSGEEENAAGQKAEEGANNLYLNHEGKTSFIAALAPEDRKDWSLAPFELSARVSPDGHHLAFLSTQAKALAGYDNTIAAGEHCQYELTIESNARFVGSPLCTQAFVYDAGAAELTCASCNPSGARPLGPTVLPLWTNPYEGPRYLSDDGSRLFFESFDALTAADESEKMDVYEFEREGAGNCSSENPAFDPASGGCHFLISSGQSSDESFLVDASADGRDAFFSTRTSLVGWDVNENFDVYDARAGGGFAEPSQAPICEGEGCKGPATAPPVTPSAVTPNVQSSGNVVVNAKQKHKKKRKHKAKKRHSKANREGGTGR